MSGFLKGFKKAERERLDAEFGKDREQTAHLCVVTKGMQRAVDKWLKDTVYPEVITTQKAATVNPSVFHREEWAQGFPYTGAIGGGVSYHFCMTSIGDIVSATYDTADKSYKLSLIDHCNL